MYENKCPVFHFYIPFSNSAHVYFELSVEDDIVVRQLHVWPDESIYIAFAYCMVLKEFVDCYGGV